MSAASTGETTADELAGPLAGMRVIELASEFAPLAGKMLGDLGAEVILVEPPGGHPTRSFEPFVDDVPDRERSLWWWHYHTSKLGVVVDLDDADGAETFRRLVASADIVVEAEPTTRLASLGLDHTDLRAAHPGVVWASITPFGRTSPRAGEQATDLTILAGGGPVWNCGYDDHSLPPVRGGGNQGYHTACLWAVQGIMAALVFREVSGQGQHLDVSMHAAANVTTEAGSYEWLVAQRTVQRQTGRHAAPTPTLPTHALASDGRYVNTGVPPRRAEEFQVILDTLDELGLREGLDAAALVELGVERGGLSFAEAATDPEVLMIFGAIRDCVHAIAEHLPAQDFFLRMQDGAIPCGPINSPEEVFTDPHFVAHGFPVEVEHDDLGRTITYPGAPFQLPRSPWRISRRAPHLGEHDEQVLGPLR